MKTAAEVAARAQWVRDKLWLTDPEFAAELEVAVAAELEESGCG